MQVLGQSLESIYFVLQEYWKLKGKEKGLNLRDAGIF